MTTIRIPRKRALKTLMDLLKRPGLSGHERPVAETIQRSLLKIGLPRKSIFFDNAHQKIPGNYSCGNLIAKLPGTIRGPRRVLIGHMDTVPLCKNAVPRRLHDRIVPAGPTGLGADNRTAVAAMITAVEQIFIKDLPHPPLTLLFTVGEEVGLWGAKTVSLRDLGNPAYGINIDSGEPASIITGAIGANRWKVEIHGLSAHAGMHPEHGVSAIMIAAQAISKIKRRGYWGRIRKRQGHGTCNIGAIEGGEATNQVTDFVSVRGESRSHDPHFLAVITKACRTAFEEACAALQNHEGQRGTVQFTTTQDYASFRIDPSAPIIQLAQRVTEEAGLIPSYKTVNGGLDANALNARGLPTITIGAGQHGAHTLKEYVDLNEYYEGCRLALQFAISANSA